MTRAGWELGIWVGNIGESRIISDIAGNQRIWAQDQYNRLGQANWQRSLIGHTAKLNLRFGCATAHSSFYLARPTHFYTADYRLPGERELVHIREGHPEEHCWIFNVLTGKYSSGKRSQIRLTPFTAGPAQSDNEQSELSESEHSDGEYEGMPDLVDSSDSEDDGDQPGTPRDTRNAHSFHELGVLPDCDPPPNERALLAGQGDRDEQRQLDVAIVATRVSNTALLEHAQRLYGQLGFSSPRLEKIFRWLMGWQEYHSTKTHLSSHKWAISRSESCN